MNIILFLLDYIDIFITIHRSANSTFAWYTAAAASVADMATPPSGTIKTAGSSINANSFTINAIDPSVEGSIALTDTSGNTYVSVPNAAGTSYTEQLASTTAAKYLAIELKAQVVYAGDLTSADDIEALWADVIGNQEVTITCSVTLGAATGKVKGTPATSDVAYCTYSNGSITAWTGGASSVTSSGADEWQFTVNGNTKQTAQISLGTIYVAIRGSNDVVWDSNVNGAGQVYNLTFTPTHA